VHRLLKNRVRESTGCGAYALFTESAVKALALDELTAEMAAHEERYEHLGNIRGWVYDVGAQRARAHASREVKVAPEGAFLTLSAEVPAPPAIAWEYYANPRHRQHWFQADQWILEGASAGRRRTGTIEHCVHGKEHSIIRTLDWKPMNYATQAFDLPFGGRMMCTTSFEATEEGTRLTVIFGRPEHERPLGRAALGVMMTLLGKSLRRDLATRVQALFGLIRAAGASELTPAEMSSSA
jgi:hypothetical protein